VEFVGMDQIARMRLQATMKRLLPIFKGK